MRAVRLLGALALSLGAALIVPASPLTPAAPAAAAGCASSSGVTVVIDYNQQRNDELVQGCVADGGDDLAYDLFAATGARQEGTREFPGFICRVNGLPGTDTENCRTASPADAYWSLWWTDGKGGDWVYSSLGVKALRVPDGGYVAWSWQGQQAKAKPSLTPSARPAPGGGDTGGSGGDGGSGGSNGGSSSPGDGASSDGPSTDRPAGGASDDSTGGGGTGGEKARSGKSGRGSGSDGGTGRGAKDGKGDRAEGGDKAARRDRDRGTNRGNDGVDESVDSPLTDADGDTEEVSSATEEDPSGLPVWVPLAVLVVLAAGGVGAVVWRRRASGGT